MYDYIFYTEIINNEFRTYKRFMCMWLEMVIICMEIRRCLLFQVLAVIRALILDYLQGII